MLGLAGSVRWLVNNRTMQALGAAFLRHVSPDGTPETSEKTAWWVSVRDQATLGHVRASKPSPGVGGNRTASEPHAHSSRVTACRRAVLMGGGGCLHLHLHILLLLFLLLLLLLLH
eukprot:3809962-Pyramimonas_sp.AAC.1